MIPAALAEAARRLRVALIAVTCGLVTLLLLVGAWVVLR